MAKAIALITLLLAALITLPAWGQDDSGSEDEGVEASDEFGNDEEASAADEALDEANLEDEAVLEEIANVDDADDEASEDDTSLGLTDSADVPTDTTPTDTTPTDTSPTDTSGCRSPPTGTTPLYPGSSRRGTVRIFNETRGSGFITDNSTNQEIFVHASGLIDNVFPGDCVTFDVDQGRTGLQAVNVKKI